MCGGPSWIGGIRGGVGVSITEVLTFLREVHSHVEQVAQAATPGPWRHDPTKHWCKINTAWFEESVFAGPTGKEAICVAGTGETDDPHSMADATHIAPHDPVSVLRRITAERKILAAYQKVRAEYEAEGPTWHQESERGIARIALARTEALEEALRAFAEAWGWKEFSDD